MKRAASKARVFLLGRLILLLRLKLGAKPLGFCSLWLHCKYVDLLLSTTAMRYGITVVPVIINWEPDTEKLGPCQREKSPCRFTASALG